MGELLEMDAGTNTTIDLSKPFYTSPRKTMTRQELQEDLVIDWVSEICNGDPPRRGDLRSRLYNEANPPSLEERHAKGFDLHRRETLDALHDDHADDRVPDVNDTTGLPYYAYVNASTTRGRKNGRATNGRLIPSRGKSLGFQQITNALELLSHYEDLRLDEDDLERLHGLVERDNDRVRSHTRYDVFPTGDGSIVYRPTSPNAQERLKNHDFGMGDHGPLILGDLPLITYVSDAGLIDEVPTDEIVPPSKLEFRYDDETLEDIEEWTVLPVHHGLPATGVRTGMIDAVEHKKMPVRRNRPWPEFQRCTHWNLSSEEFHNPFIIVDVDREDALDVYQDAVEAGRIPPASYVIINHANGHVQLAYLIPPARRGCPRQTGMMLLIKGVLVAALDGDRNETNGRCRNPFYIGCNGSREDGRGVDHRGKTVWNDIEVRVPDASKTGGCRSWTMAALKDFLVKSGEWETYHRGVKAERRRRGFADAHRGAIGDGKTTALDPRHIQGQLVPMGERNSITTRVVDHHIWTDRICDEDQLVQLVLEELSYEQVEGDLYGEADVRGVVRSALRFHKKHYDPRLDARSELHRRNLRIDGQGNCVDADGRVVCRVEDLSSSKKKRRKSWFAVSSGRKGGSRNSEAQRVQRAAGLGAGVKRNERLFDQNREAVRAAMEAVEADPSRLTVVRSDGRKIEISPKAAVWREIEAGAVKMGKTTCYRHYKALVEEKSREAHEIHGDVNQLVTGNRETVSSGVARPSLEAAGISKGKMVFFLNNVAVVVVDVMVPKLMELGFAEDAVKVLDGVIAMERVLKGRILTARDKTFQDAKNQILGGSEPVMRRAREVFFNNGLKRMEAEVEASGVSNLLRVQGRFVSKKDTSRRPSPRVADVWTGAPADQMDWSDTASVRDWVADLSDGAEDVARLAGALGWVADVPDGVPDHAELAGV